MSVIECVPNVSEGRRPDIIASIAEALRGVPRLRVLDVQSDASHNRSVFTLAGDADAMAEGIPVLFERAISAIDLRAHRGEHPRLGAVDVVPFVPIAGVTMADCVALAKRIGADVAGRFDLPVYLYEDAASQPHRKGLEDIRRGEFEGLAAKMSDPAWAPDFGPPRPHPSAGASVIGARMPLIAYNINLATDRLDVAKKIASAIRMSSGGFR
ncbi:MAG: glutamate formimidoyltransferase, partial [Steroidobacteraceae bacterium]